MFKKTALVAGIGLALSATAQADYQWELGGAYTYGEIQADLKPGPSDDIDENIGELFGTWYFENVDTSKGPLNEAAFLDHASNITVFATDGEVDLNSIDNRLSDKDGQTYGFNSRYVAEGPGWKLSGWLGELGYEYLDLDNSIDTYHAAIGKYVTPNTTIVLNYDRIDVSAGGDTNGYSLDLDHFFAFSNGGLKVNASAGKVVVSDADDVEQYELGGTWYLTNNLGFGAGYMNTQQDGYEVNSWAVNANWFITESFAMDLSYGQADFDDIDLIGGQKLQLEQDVARLEAKFRF
ncbi:MAG: putative porin [Halioglobus sp.]|nr:putative porin [Halioglobus sp.]